MKVRKRITVAFTGIYSTLIIPLSIIVYISVYTTRKNVFYNQLRERVEITEQFFLESDRLSDEVRDEMRSNFLKTLPNEIEYVEKANGFKSNLPDSVLVLLPEGFNVKQLQDSDDLAWSKNKKQGVAKSYTIGQEDYVVLVMAEDIIGHAYVKQLGLILLIGCLITISVAFVLSNYFAVQILKPIANKIKKANRISAKNLDMRLTVYNENDELGMLAISFNSLLDRLQMAFELEKNFVKYASHEIKNPLAVIIGNAELALSQNRTSNEYIDAIEKIRDKAYSLNDFVSQFLQLAKLEGENIKMADLRIDELIIDIVSSADEFHYKDLEINLTIDEDMDASMLVVKGNEDLIRNALTNLINNAKKFSYEQGRIEIIIRNKNERLEVLVKDQGIGIDEHEIEHIFNPLYRADNAQGIEGTGLGLALTKKIMDLHQFNIQVVSASSGTTFSIQF